MTPEQEELLRQHTLLRNELVVNGRVEEFGTLHTQWIASSERLNREFGAIAPEGFDLVDFEWETNDFNPPIP